MRTLSVLMAVRIVAGSLSGLLGLAVYLFDGKPRIYEVLIGVEEFNQATFIVDQSVMVNMVLVNLVVKILTFKSEVEMVHGIDENMALKIKKVPQILVHFTIVQ